MPIIENGKTFKQSDGNHTWTLQEIYKDNQGNTWSALVDAESLPAKRYASMDIKQSYLDIGIDKFTMREIVKKSRELVEAQSYENIPKLLNWVDERLDFDFNRWNVLELASVMYVINDEDIFNFSEYYEEKKMEAFKKDHDCADFFLTYTYEIAKKLNTKYQAFSKTNLMELVIKEKMLNNSFGNLMRKLK